MKYDVFEKLLKERKVRACDVSKATKVSVSTLSDWKAGRYQPKIDKIIAIARFFNVPVDCFIEEVLKQ